MLEEHRSVLDKIADALIEFETLDAADVDLLVSGGSITRAPPPKPLAAAHAEKKKGGLLDAAPIPAASKA